MTFQVEIHRPSKVEAKTTGVRHWVAFYEGDNMVTVFCPSTEAAKIIANAWNNALRDTEATVKKEKNDD